MVLIWLIAFTIAHLFLPPDMTEPLTPAMKLAIDNSSEPVFKLTWWKKIDQSLILPGTTLHYLFKSHGIDEPYRNVSANSLNYGGINVKKQLSQKIKEENNPFEEMQWDVNECNILVVLFCILCCLFTVKFVAVSAQKRTSTSN